MFDKVFAQHPTIYKYDRLWIGILLGLVTPCSGIFFIYLLSFVGHYADPTHPDIIPIHTMIHSISDLSLLMKYLSVGCMLNLGVFYLFINRDYFNIARGIIFSTILISIPVIGTIVIGWFK